jgi:hypothetical protein
MERRRATEFEIDTRGRIPFPIGRPAGIVATVDRRRIAFVGDDRRPRLLDHPREATGVVAVLVGEKDRRHVIGIESSIVEALGELIDGLWKACIEHQQSAFGFDGRWVQRHLAVFDRDIERERMNVFGKGHARLRVVSRS